MTENLRIGILGAGWAAESHATAYLRLPNVEVTALWSRTRTRAEVLAGRLNQPGLRIFDHWQQLIEQGDVDVLSVATPPMLRGEPVDVTVHKIWEVNQYSGNVVPNDTTVVIWCNAEIENGNFDSTSGYWFLPFEVVGDTSSTVGVLPEYPSSICWATENIAYSEVEVDNQCGDSAGSAQMEISAGVGDECTITNTVFFEGIPTLNQYGLALLAVLTLGIGAVGMRRFI